MDGPAGRRRQIAWTAMGVNDRRFTRAPIPYRYRKNMFDRLLAGMHADSPAKLLEAVLERMNGQPSMVVLDALYNLLRDGLAAAPGGALAQRWLDVISPVADQWVTRAMAELAVGEDNPVRRDLAAKRLTLLTDQLAHVCYIEAARADAALSKGSGRVSTLVEWTTGYFHWLGRAHTSRALLDCSVTLPWEGICSLHRAMATHGALPAQAAPATREPMLGLAYLLLIHDTFPVVGEQHVAAAAAIAGQLAPQVLLADDFHRLTPFLMLPDAGEAQRIVGWTAGRRPSAALCYGLDEVIRSVDILIADIAAGQPTLWLHGIGEVERLLRQLRYTWVERPGRCRNPAIRRSGPAQAAFGWLRIRGLLAQKTARVPAKDPLLRRVELDDANESGVSLLLEDRSLPLLGDGVFALRIAGKWWLAQPLRIEPDDAGCCYVVARWLAQEADPIRLLSAQGEAWRALFLHPGPANRYQARVLVDSGTLALGTGCHAELGDRTFGIEPIAVEPLGAGLWRYDCVVLEA